MLSPTAMQVKTVVASRCPAVASAYRALRRLVDPGSRDRRTISDHIRRHTDSCVVTGPFAGMRLVTGSSWGDGDVAPKLLGTYEQELHDAIACCRNRRYGALVDLGCAEGYYAVGLARVFPSAPVYAFDTDAAALRVAQRAAESNGVTDRITFGGFCDSPTLDRLVADHGRLLIVSDCEGHEADLFGTGTSQSLDRSDLIIECHDRIRPGSTEAMVRALAATHGISRIEAIGRNPNQFPFLTGIHERDRWLAVCENRPYCSHWLFCESLASA